MMTGARRHPDASADERTSLTQFLDYYRLTIVMKATGLTDEQARWSPVPSGTSLLGLVRHLAEVERGWFRINFAGEEIGYLYGSDEDPDGDFRAGPEDTLADALAAYDEECEAARAVVAAAPSLDQPAVRPSPRYGVPVNLRWVLVHMIEETARHAGHADIIRELIDGSTGR